MSSFVKVLSVFVFRFEFRYLEVEGVGGLWLVACLAEAMGSLLA